MNLKVTCRENYFLNAKFMVVSNVHTHRTEVQNENWEEVDQMNSNEGRFVCVASCDEGWVYCTLRCLKTPVKGQ